MFFQRHRRHPCMASGCFFFFWVQIKSRAKFSKLYTHDTQTKGLAKRRMRRFSSYFHAHETNPAACAPQFGPSIFRPQRQSWLCTDPTSTAPPSHTSLTHSTRYACALFMPPVCTSKNSASRCTRYFCEPENHIFFHGTLSSTNPKDVS